jgi:hypothetical protein
MVPRAEAKMSAQREEKHRDQSKGQHSTEGRVHLSSKRSQG